MRDVTVEELFTWKDELARKAKEAFGSHHAYVNKKTYDEIRDRCELRIPCQTVVFWQGSNSCHIHVDDSVPDGILRGK